MDKPADTPTDSFFPERIQIGGTNVVVSDPENAAQSICDLASLPLDEGHHIHLVNAYTLALADSDADVKEVLVGDAINLPDGKPLGWVARIFLGTDDFRQIRGPQLFLDTFDAGREQNIRHFLLGSTKDVLSKLESSLKERFPGANIVGAESPSFGTMSPEEYAAQDERIWATEPDIVWVGLGTPKQDFEARRLAMTLPVVAVGVGAAFDFTAGTLRHAPGWMIKVGLEWLFRLLSEPRRLWRRYLMGNARFMFMTARQVIGSRWN